jgi:hypothetical protein
MKKRLIGILALNRLAPMYWLSRRRSSIFARLASQIFLIRQQKSFFSKLLVLGKFTIVKGKGSRQEKIFHNRRCQFPRLDLPEPHLAQIR